MGEPVTFGLTIGDEGVARRVGRLLVRLRALKHAFGVDWQLHSSWCSEIEISIGRVRIAAGDPAGVPFTGGLEDVLIRMVRFAEDSVRVRETAHGA